MRSDQEGAPTSRLLPLPCSELVALLTKDVSEAAARTLESGTAVGELLAVLAAVPPARACRLSVIACLHLHLYHPS